MNSKFDTNSNFQRKFKSIAFVLILIANSVSSAWAENDRERSWYKDFVDGIGGTLYYLSWPTATYKGASFEGVSNVYNGVDIKIKLNGISSFDDSSLWTEVIVNVRNGEVRDISWGRNNAILAQPGEAIKALGVVISELNKEYSRSKGSSSRLSPPPLENNKGWTICNKSDEPKVYVSYIYKDEVGWVGKGWRNISKGECSLIIDKLTTRYVYYYAEGENGKWTGNQKSCAHPSEEFTNRSNTCSGELKVYPYIKVDTGEHSRWTTNLTE